MIHRTTAYYVYSAKKALNFRYVILAVFFAGLAATYAVYKMVPTGFVPDEDQGWFMITVQAPQGASVEYTSQAMRQVEAVLRKGERHHRRIQRRGLQLYRQRRQQRHDLP